MIFGFKQKPTKYTAGYAVTEIRKNIPWCNNFHAGAEITAFQQGLDASNKHIKSCVKKRKARINGKKIAGH